MQKEAKEVIVMSLGGSLIVPEDIDIDFLNKFRQIIKNHTNRYKFVIVTGGGSVARKYINALRQDKKSEYLQSLIGICVTRLNARFMSYFFGIDPEKGIAHDMKNVRDLLKTRNIIICGALRYASNQTSDSTSVKLAAYLKASFVNLTNVKGLYDKNPLTDKSAKFIPKATIEELNKIVMAIPNKPGMHAPLDHAAMRTIKQHKIKTYIIGKDAKQLDNFLNKKAFIGTIVE